MQNHPENPETLEDIIFQNRNKSYGAYSLRADYSIIISRALLIGIGLFCLAVLTPMIWAKVEWKQKRIVDITLRDLKIQEPPQEIEPPVKPETPPPAEPKPQIKQIDFTNKIEIVDTDEEIEPIPDQQTLTDSNAQISDKNQDGELREIPVDDPDIGKGMQPDQPVEVKVEDNQIYIAVEQMPEYAGGVAALSKFLQKNLRYPNPAASACVSGKVYVQFVVGQDGSITKVDILKGLGFGCDEEAERVIKLMPHWSSGKQSGRAIAVKFTLPINFQLSN